MSLVQTFDFGVPGITAGYTTRHGGVSTGVYESLNLGDHVGDSPALVEQNRSLVASSVGVSALTIPDQQHADRAVVITPALVGAARAALPATDGLVTDVVGACIAVMVADCAPVVLIDPVRRAVGVAHCGRRGALLGTLPATITLMSSTYGTRAADLLVGIGPCIGAASYEVGAAEIASVLEAYPTLPVLTATRPGHANLDIVAILRHQLSGAGVPDSHVVVSGIDTLTATDDYFSDRAERPCGRFVGLVAIQSSG